MMNLVGKSKLKKDALKHGDTKCVIEAWIKVVEDVQWNNITEVELTYQAMRRENLAFQGEDVPCRLTSTFLNLC